MKSLKVRCLTSGACIWVVKVQTTSSTNLRQLGNFLHPPRIKKVVLPPPSSSSSAAAAASPCDTVVAVWRQAYTASRIVTPEGWFVGGNRHFPEMVREGKSDTHQTHQHIATIKR